MKSLITLLSLVVITAPATVLAGGFIWTDNEEAIEGRIVDNKQAAYTVGLEMIEDYQAMSSQQLRDEFIHGFAHVDRHSFSITDATVMVEEFLQGNGDIVYQPVLNVSYEYRVRELGGSR